MPFGLGGGLGEPFKLASPRVLGPLSLDLVLFAGLGMLVGPTLCGLAVELEGGSLSISPGVFEASGDLDSDTTSFSAVVSELPPCVSRVDINEASCSSLPSCWLVVMVLAWSCGGGDLRGLNFRPPLTPHWDYVPHLGFPHHY